MDKGFTLVELSIVLVIVGLLIGGILVAQSMVTTSQTVAGMAQLQQFDAAAMAFKSKFKYLPGDAPAFGGDGDNQIESFNASTSTNGSVGSFCGEISNYWHQLTDGGFKAGTYTTGGGTAADVFTTTGPNKSVPESKMGIKAAVYASSVVNTAVHATWHDTTQRNFYSFPKQNSSSTITSQTRFQSSANGNKTFKAADLAAIDSKFDDGNPLTGNILSGNFQDTGSHGYGRPSITPVSTCSSGSSYLTNVTTYECMPLIRIGMQSGDPS